MGAVQVPRQSPQSDDEDSDEDSSAEDNALSSEYVEDGKMF